jgi:23S rRNA pseudouridine1911/1915/1917 synthase
VDAAAAGLVGLRCDQALAALLPGMGLRGRRRCLERGGALLNGRPASPARRLVPGDVLGLTPRPEPALPGPEAEGARLVSRQGDYCFFFKPAGLHTAALAGDAAPSLESLLPRLTAALADPTAAAAPEGLPRVHWHAEPVGFCQLLQRLDCGTSGLVCAALRPEAAQAFRQAEAHGRCDKRYVALLEGHLAAPAATQAALDTADRRRSRVLPGCQDQVRGTEFFPLRYWPPDRVFALTAAFFAPGVLAAAGLAASAPAATGKAQALAAPPAAPRGLTLAACRIHCGARHQIRAHAAFLGHPLWGDSLYGGTGEGVFWLHHGGLILPAAACALPPPWPLPPQAAAAVEAWFRPEKDFFHPPATTEVF